MIQVDEEERDRQSACSRPRAGRIQSLDEGAAIQHTRQRIGLGTTLGFGQRDALAAEPVGDAECDQDRCRNHRQRQAVIEQDVAPLAVGQQELQGGSYRERLQEHPGEQEPPGCATPVSPRDERHGQGEYRGADEQNIAEGVYEALEPEQLGKVGHRQDSEGHGEPAERRVGAVREETDVGHLPHEQAGGYATQGDREVPSVGGQRQSMRKDRPFEALTR